MSRTRFLACITFLGACSPGLPPASQHLYVVQYKAPLNGADSTVISGMGGSIVFAIPLAKAIIFRSSRSSAEVRSIPDTWNVTSVESLNQVINAAVLFKNAPTAGEIAAVLAVASVAHVASTGEDHPNVVEAGFRLSTVNNLASIGNITEVDLEIPPGHAGGS